MFSLLLFITLKWNWTTYLFSLLHMTCANCNHFRMYSNSAVGFECEQVYWSVAYIGIHIGCHDSYVHSLRYHVFSKSPIVLNDVVMTGSDDVAWKPRCDCSRSLDGDSCFVEQRLLLGVLASRSCARTCCWGTVFEPMVSILLVFMYWLFKISQF